MNYFVYVLENKKGQWYIGQTNNLDFRIEKHNNQKIRSTKNRGKWNIIYKESFDSRSLAMQKEEFLKSGAGRKLLKALLRK